MVKRVIGAAAVILGFLAIAGAVAGISLKGSHTVNPFHPGEQRFDVTAETGIAAELDGTPRIQRQSLRVSCTESRLFDPLSFTGDAAFSLFQAKDVEVQWTLQGPIDGSVQKTQDLGNIVKGGTKQAGFRANNLPGGQYVLHVDVFSNTGSDYVRRTVTCQ